MVTGLGLGAVIPWYLLSGETSGQEIRPGRPVEGEPILFEPNRWRDRLLSTQLIPWRGERLVLLTTNPNFNMRVMGRFVRRLDSGWKLYADLVGRSPALFKSLSGKPTITAVPNGDLTCGYGCGFVGLSGIEVAGFYNDDYPLVVRRPNAFPHYYFYEMGRNYYLFGERHSLFTTGFAVFMRYVCMDTLRCEDPDSSTRATIERCEAVYARSDIPFIRAFTNLLDEGEKANRLSERNGNPIIPSDQPVMYATAMLKLRKDLGGNAWLRRYFAVLARCPDVVPDNESLALRQCLNWLVSASIAARKDLTPVFVDRWRMPLSRAARETLRRIPWTSPNLDPAVILARLSVE